MAACDAMDWAPLAVLAGQASHTYRLDGGGRKRGTVQGRRSIRISRLGALGGGAIWVEAGES